MRDAKYKLALIQDTYALLTRILHWRLDDPLS